jgi:hypothetical protein
VLDERRADLEPQPTGVVGRVAGDLRALEDEADAPVGRPVPASKKL